MMDRKDKWGSIMSCLESVKECAQELLDSDDIYVTEWHWFEKEIGLIEDTTRNILSRWEAEEAADIEANTLSIDLRYESLDMLRTLCDYVGVEHGTRKEMIARLKE